MKLSTVEHALLRNGVILERAKRRGESLSKIERIIVLAGRKLAREQGFAAKSINALEMEGERDWDQVLQPLIVKAVFAYFDGPYEGFEPRPDYEVLESNHPGLPVGSHVCADQLVEVDIKVPKTPKYEAWAKRLREQKENK